MASGWQLLLVFLELSQVSAQTAWHATNCAEGRKAIVHLFEWKWNDIALECERFLGPRGFCGVQTSPPMDHLTLEEGNPGNEYPHPWWQRYQPVGYNLDSRSGTEVQFFDMVARCNAVNVRIYVDAVINHMAGVGRNGTGSGGSEFFSDGDAPYFPNAGFTSASDFNDCSSCDGCCCVNAWTDFDNVRNCRLLGLIDIKADAEYPRSQIAALFNKMIDGGVAGFRIDAAKHMWPEDIQNIMSRTNDLPTSHGFAPGSKALVAMEVIDLNQWQEVSVHMYKHIGLVTEFRFCSKINNAADYLEQVQYLWDSAWGMIEPEYAFVFVDNHDNQRGHGGGGEVVTHQNPTKYAKAQALTLAQYYGQPRVMSSYYFENTDEGPPHYLDYTTADVVINPDHTCSGGWVCEHRWPAIAGMVGWAKAVSGASDVFDNWWQEGNKVAWSRGGKGFVAISNEGGFSATLNTGLPAGDYCNVITGCATSTGCEGQTVTVDGSGNANVNIDYGEPAIFAIHVEALSGSDNCYGMDPPDLTTTTSTTAGPTTTTDQPPSTTTTTPPDSTTTTTPGGTTTTPGGTTTTPVGSTVTPPQGWRRTIVYLNVQTNDGQDVFLRGGLDASIRPGCTEEASTSDCAINFQQVSLGADAHYAKYNAWGEGDLQLDWWGSQTGQGDYQGLQADGTPLAWTTTDSSHPGFQPDNSWGAHYWKAEFDMDCSQTENGWFEFKGFMTNGAGWEDNITSETCTGTEGGTPSYISSNHMALCGFRNVFSWNSASCQIDVIS